MHQETAPATDASRPTTPPPALLTSPPRLRRSTGLLSASAAILPMLAMYAWVYVIQADTMTIGDLLLWPMLAGGGMIFWILFLHLSVCGDTLDSLGFRAGRIGLDLLLGAVLGVGFLLLHFATREPLARLFPPRPPAEEIVTLLGGLSRDPWLLAVWLGPVVWIGVAGFEELWRAFVLRRLWNVWGGPAGKWAAVLFVSALVGLGHAYQGPASVISIAVKSVLMGAFFMATGRIRALIVAHAIYDSVQIVMAVVAIRSLTG